MPKFFYINVCLEKVVRVKVGVSKFFRMRAAIQINFRIC